MRVTREDVRQLVVGKIYEIVLANNMRFQAPGLPRVDISINKAPYARLDIIYLDGFTTGLGQNARDRLMGNIVVEMNYKEGSAGDLILVNDFLDKVQVAISNQDLLYPVRTYTSKQQSPQDGVESGWLREALLTPFWYDS